MASGRDALALARRNFEQAKAKKPADLAATTSPAQAKAVLDNYGAALNANLDALADAFQQATGQWDGLLAEAAKAEQELNEARQNAMAIGERIVAMGKLTAAVGKLVDAVKGAAGEDAA